MNQHWNEVRLKEYAQILLSNIDKKSYDGEKSVLLCNYTDVYYNKTIHKDIKFMPATASEAQIKKLTLKYNDVIITKDSESADDIGIPAIVKHTEQNLVCGYHLAIIRSKKLDGNYINYLFQSKVAKEYFLEVCLGFTRVSLNKGDILNFKFNMPPLEQQTKIANYLDQETSKIDRKISILEQKYEKLEEYKQSVIFETVTKGLDKNVELKDSGIDWIGDIPKHWEVKRVKEFYKLGMGQTILKEDLIDDGKYPVYSATAEDKFFGYVNKINNPLNIGDLVIPARGNSIGHVKLVKEIVACTQTTIYMKQKSKIDSSFVYYYLLGNKPQLFFFDDTAIPQITVEQINGRLMLVPSSHEQKEIVVFLNDLCSKIDKKVEIIKKQIDLLKEYKQTIIYEAVTGKIEIQKY